MMAKLSRIVMTDSICVFKALKIDRMMRQNILNSRRLGTVVDLFRSQVYFRGSVLGHD